MEQRKIILLGKVAACVTLPRSWMIKHKLKKGDTVYIQETPRHSLELISSIMKPPSTRSLTIDVANKSAEEIGQMLNAAYVNGYTQIILQGRLNGKVTYVRNHIAEFPRAEIMLITSDDLRIQVLEDIETTDLKTSLRRIDNIIRGIFDETISLLEEPSSSDDIKEKGDDVQRQVLFAQRAVNYALNNAAAAQKFNLAPVDINFISYVVFFSGKIAEFAVPIAGIIRQGQLDRQMSPESKTEIKALLKHVFGYYNQVIDIYRSSDHHKFVMSEYLKYEKLIREFSDKSHQVWRPVVAEYLLRLILIINEMEFVMINLENSPKLA